MTYCDPAGQAVEASGWPASGGGLCATTCTGTFSAANCASPSNFLKGFRHRQRPGRHHRSNDQGDGSRQLHRSGLRP